MKYTGSFKNINNKSFFVDILTNGEASTSKSVVLADSPFVVSYEGGDEILYKECKYSSATIRIVSKDYNFDLYSSTAQQNKVTLYDGGYNVVWIGYLTSNLYNADYENPEEIIELEAIDALSTLQYYKYTTEKKSVVSFSDILVRLLSKCNAYTEFFISDNLRLKENPSEALPDIFYISEQNFFDEDNEPMTMQEVLEEICKYLNVTCVAEGDKVYFLDYDAIAKGNNNYFRYQLDHTNPKKESCFSTGEWKNDEPWIMGKTWKMNPEPKAMAASASSTKVTLSHTKAIKGSDYAESGNQISLDNVYNKVAVKDSLYSFDSIIPSIWDDKYLTNYGGSGYTQIVDEDGKGGMHKCFFKYFKHKNYKSYYYDKTTKQEVATPSSVNYAYTQKYIGATICKHFSEKVTDFNGKYNDINYTDYVLLHCHDTTAWHDTVKRKLFSLEINDDNSSFLGGGTYLIVKGDFRYLDRESEMYIMQGYMNKDDDFNPVDLFIWARLQYGNLYWNGTAWTSTPSDFKLYYDANGQTDHCINQVFSIKNNITWEMGLQGEEGYAIPVPNKDEVVVGKPTFTLYQPYKLAKSYRCDAVWLSNFDIIAVVQNLNPDVDKDSDTEYSNVINEDYVNELDDVEFKICTWDNKEANFSAVAYQLNNKYYYVDNIFNYSTNQTLRPEEHYIYKLVNQYSTPSVILNLNLKNEYHVYSTITDKFLKGKKFIVDSQEIDYEYNKSIIKLIEKK